MEIIWVRRLVLHAIYLIAAFVMTHLSDVSMRTMLM